VQGTRKRDADILYVPSILGLESLFKSFLFELLSILQGEVDGLIKQRLYVCKSKATYLGIGNIGLSRMIF
jgi:hypothetical protein